MEVLVVGLVFWAFMIGLGCFVAEQKGRDVGEGLLLAFLFGPFGVLIEALLPSKQRAQVGDDAQIPSRDNSTSYNEALARFEAKIKADQEAEAERQRQAVYEWRAYRERKRTERRDAYLARGISPGPFAWIEAFSMDLTNWYKSASDLMQMLVIAACVSVPAGLLAILFFKSR